MHNHTQARNIVKGDYILADDDEVYEIFCIISQRYNTLLFLAASHDVDKPIRGHDNIIFYARNLNTANCVKILTKPEQRTCVNAPGQDPSLMIVPF